MIVIRNKEKIENEKWKKEKKNSEGVVKLRIWNCDM